MADGGQVKLRLFGALRDATGQKEVTLPCSGCTVHDVLVRFVEQWGDQVRRFVFDEQGNEWRSLILLLNDEPVADGPDTRVRAGDVVALLLPVAGG